MTQENKPIVNEIFTDNGEHSHWELIDSTNGKILWTESDASTSSPIDVEQEANENYVEKILHGMFPAHAPTGTYADAVRSLRSAMIFANNLPQGAALTGQLVDIACLIWDYENSRLKAGWEARQRDVVDDEMYLNMQYYMEYCKMNGYVTPQDWLKKYKHF